MQNICCLFNLDNAKFTPILKVAGKAGGTTIVMRSRARTTMVCHATFITVRLTL